MSKDQGPERSSLVIGHDLDKLFAALFDCDWYESQLEACGLHNVSEPPFVHFCRVGSANFLSPHPLFDPRWYVEQNEQARAALECGMQPHEHFLSIGHLRGYWPHPLFDVQWYKHVNGLAPTDNALIDFVTSPACENRSTHPHFDAGWYGGLHVNPHTWKKPAILHFVRRGQACGYKPNPWGIYDARSKLVVTDSRPYKLSRAPFVSIIVVNLNGERHLRNLLSSLQRQSYVNFELVFVDNGSTDRSLSLVREAFPVCKIVNLKSNVGFAEANNIGYREASGELIALLNNDTLVGDAFLESLVAVLQSDVNIGAVCPRIRFAGRFCELKLRARWPFVVDEELLLSTLAYKKLFTRKGGRSGHCITSTAEDEIYVIELLIPVQTAPYKLKITASEQATSVAISTQYLKFMRDVPLDGAICELTLEDHDFRNGSFLINNAGGAEPAWLTTSDIGFGHFDDGRFSHARDVALLCGCATLIRRDALLGRELFLDAFFAYFEDSELSQRLRRAGFRIRYCPEAIVYHHHSATAIEYSPFWMKQVHRNSIVYRFVCSDFMERAAQVEDRLAALQQEAQEFSADMDNLNYDVQMMSELLPSIDAEARSICAGIAAGKLAVRRDLRVGIFNAYWNTLGGGEAHALAYAAHLAKRFTIELISIDDFDINHLAKYFHLDQSVYVKRLILTLSTSITAEYDIFINSSYMDECPSAAPYSWYLVSFPSRSPTKEFLESYKFVANSHYTYRWMTYYWGSDIRASVVNPTVSDKLVAANGIRQGKERFVLSVGRFFRNGHSKHQAVVADCFRRLQLETSAARNWKLVLIGSVGDLSYVDDVRESLGGADHELITNASIETVRDYYGRAAIYVHASGLGEDPERSPENFEHFGMTVAEAVANACLPIVHDSGGPAEIVDRFGVGIKFRTTQELEAAMLGAMHAFSEHDHQSISGSEHFTSDRLSRDLAKLFSAIPSASPSGEQEAYAVLKKTD